MNLKCGLTDISLHITLESFMGEGGGGDRNPRFYWILAQMEAAFVGNCTDGNNVAGHFVVMEKITLDSKEIEKSHPIEMKMHYTVICCSCAAPATTTSFISPFDNDEQSSISCFDSHELPMINTFVKMYIYTAR